jgi:putative heme-binding domain-containing protein
LRQSAVHELAGTTEGEREIHRLVDAFHSEALEPELALEVLEAADLLDASNSTIGSWPTSDVVFASRILSDGGDPTRGRDLFLHHETAQCLRCHTIDDLGGTAGPNLTFVASRLTKPRIIESLVNPGATIAEGYATIALTLHTGESISAPIIEQNADRIVIDDAGTHRAIPRAQIRAQAGPVSAMPIMPEFLSAYEARDLVAYLATLVDPALGPAALPTAAVSQTAHPRDPLTPAAAVRWAVGAFAAFVLFAIGASYLLLRISRATA